MFSVVIPLYNKELSIKNTIQSVLDQSFQEFEVIVVNDGSTDKSLERVKEINDPRIRIIEQNNQGVSAARNKGIKESNYDWIAFLDADDLWKENHLDEIVRMMEVYPNEKIYVTSFKFSDNRTLFKHKRSSEIFKIENYFKEAIKEHLISTDSIVVDKQCFLLVGNFNTKLDRGEDPEMWTRLARKFTIIKSEKITSIYRVEAENRSIENFNLESSRVFNYDFSASTSKFETQYMKNRVITVLRGFILKREFINFYKLKRKHSNYISLIDVFKRK